MTWPNGPKGAAGCGVVWHVGVMPTGVLARDPRILAPRRIKEEGVRSDGFKIFQSKSCQIHVVCS